MMSATMIPRAKELFRFATVAITAQVCLTLVAWSLPFVSEYRLMADTISELVLGRYGFVQTAAFLMAGFGTLVLSMTIRQLTLTTTASIAGSRLISTYGVGIVLLALFPTEQIDAPTDVWSQSTSGLIHAWLAMIIFPCAVAGMFLLTWAFRNQARWRSVSNISALCSVAALILLFFQGEGPLIGLLRRMLVGVISLWMILLALRVRAIAAARPSSRGA